MTNIQHLLVATDLSERSERAVARALRAAQGGRMTALHVVTAGLPVDLAGRRQKDAEDFLIKRLSGVSSPSSPDIETVVVTGDPFSAIIGEAARRQVDLIVMGEPRRQGYPDMFTGTTAERVIRFSDRPVLMVRREASDPYRRILVAFDGSEGSIRALKTALAMAPKAEFHIVHAWRPPHASFGDTEVARVAITAENNRLRPLIKQAANETITSTHPGPADVMIDMVEDNPYVVMRNQMSWADLLVLGTHSKGSLATSVTIGSLARHLLAETACDVLVSRP